LEAEHPLGVTLLGALVVFHFTDGTETWTALERPAVEGMTVGQRWRWQQLHGHRVDSTRPGTPRTS